MKISRNQIEVLIRKPIQWLDFFNPKFHILMKSAEESFAKQNNKLPGNSDSNKCIERLILTQQRLFKQLLNVTNRLVEFIKNPISYEQKVQKIEENYAKAKQCYQDQGWKEARFYVDKNQDMIFDLPDNSQLMLKHCILKGQILHSLKQAELSNYYLQRPEILEMNDYQLLYSIGLNYLTLGDKQKKQRGRKPKKPKTKPRMNQAYFRANKEVNKQYILKAIQYFNKVIELKPDEFNAYDDLCDAYRLLGFTKSYIQTRIKYQEVQTDSYKLYQSCLSVARCLYATDQKEQSAEYYNKALTLTSDSDLKLTVIAEVVQMLQSDENCYNQLIPYLEQSVEIIRDKNQSQQLVYYLNFHKLAKCYARSRMYEKQVQIYLYLFKLRENLGNVQPLDIYKDIGVSYFKLERFELAEKYLWKYINQNKFNTGVYLMLEEIYKKQQDQFAVKDVLLKWRSVDNSREVLEKLLMIEKVVGTESGIKEMEEELRLFDLANFQ